MSTRFYLPASGAAPVSPAVSADWGHSTAGKRATHLWRSGTAIGDTLVSPDAADHLVSADAMFVQFVSDPLLPQVISASTLTYAIQGSETNNGNNCSVTVRVFVCSQDGSTIKETIVGNSRDATELTTTVTNRTDTIGTSAVTLEEGDRIVFEIGIGGTPTGTGGVQGHNGALRFGDNQATDLPQDDTTTGSTNNPWVQFDNAGSLAFIEQVAPITRQPMDDAAATVVQNTVKAKRAAGVVATALACAFVPLVATVTEADAGGQSDTSIIQPAALLQYQPIAAPIAIPALEAIPEQWWPVYPDRVQAKLRPVLTGRLQFEQPMPGTLPVADAGSSSDQGGLWPAALLQYVSLSGPVAPSGDPEPPPPAPDLAIVVGALPGRILPRQQSVAVTPLYLADITVLAPELSWTPQYPDTTRRAPAVAQQQALAWHSDTPPTIELEGDAGGQSDTSVILPATLLQYQSQVGPVAIPFIAPFDAALVPYTQGPVPVRRPYARALYVWAQPHFGVEIRIPVQSWESTTLRPERIMVPQRIAPALQPAWFSDRFDAPTPVVVPEITPPVYPARVRGHLPRPVGLHVAPLHVADVTVAVPDLSWAPNYADRVFPRLALHVSQQRAWVIDRFDAPDLVVVPDLSWAPTYPDWFWVVRLPRLGGSSDAPLYVADVTVLAPSLSWAPTYPDRHRRPLRTVVFTPYIVGAEPIRFNVAWVRFNTYTGPWDKELK